VTHIGPHGHPDPDQQLIWGTIVDAALRDNPPIDLTAVELDDETLDQIVAGSDMPDTERDRILRELAGKPVFGCCDADKADVTLRAMLGGYRSTITARKLPPFNIDTGRVAHLLKRRRRRRRAIKLAYTIVIIGFLALSLAIVASASARHGDWLWPIHQFVYTTTS
jgi:hypothetical protein